MTKIKESEFVFDPQVETTISESKVQATSIPVQERDEFAEPQYLDPDAKLPRIQALRGTTPKMCGYFVAVDQMAAAGWLDFDEKQLVTYTFESSGAEERFAVVPTLLR